MAVWYVRSGAAGTASGADWTNAKTTLAAAITAGAAGDTYYVANDHAETAAAATTITFKGTTTNPDTCYCVNRAGSVPPVAADLTTGGSVTTTGANALIINGVLYGSGLTFNCGTGSTAASLTLGGSKQLWESCSFKLVTTATGSRIITPGTSSNIIEWKSCTASFGNASQGIQSGMLFRWANSPSSSAIAGATIPTTLIVTGGNPGIVSLDGLDLSALGSGATIIAAGVQPQCILTNCKLGSSVTIQATPNATNILGTDLIGCDSSSSVGRNERYRYQGTLTTETTIKRTAGASDGTTAYSWKIVSTANAKRALPFETFEGVIWNTATGSSKTLTFHCVTDNVTLQDADIWVEVEYLGSSSTPVASVVSSAPATLLTAGSNLTSDSGEAWTTTGLTTPVKQKFSVSFTPQMVGPVRWKVKVAKASTAVYVDPNPELV